MALTKVSRNLLNTSIADNGTGTAITIASDGSVTFSSTISASGYNNSNWDTAYGWGDHSVEGYLTSHQDITGKLDKSGGTMTGNITFASAQTFDGRDVSVDGAKLDNIEAGADVTDTANVVAALTAGTNVSIGSDGTISSTDTNTTYSVGDGGLTQKNFTTALKSKLDGIASGAEVNVNADWNASSGDAQILNKPTIPSLSGYATESYVNTQVSNLVDSSPSTLNTLNELAAALGDDANFSTTVSNQIGTKWTQDNTKISNWDTAYGWGNHATAGYLTSFDITTQTDPKYLRSDTADTSTGLTTFNGGISVLSGHGVGKFRIKRTASSTDGDDITDIHMDDGGIFVDIDNDNDGDSGNFKVRYKTGGSFTNLLFASPTTFTYKNQGIWHSGNDGSGSGLDADTLDGSHASVFAPKSAPDFTGEVYTDSSQNAWAFRATTGTTNNSSGLWFTGTTARLLLRDSSGTIKTMLAANGTNSENVINNNTIWHAGNDGSGSGLDADTVDGIHANRMPYALTGSLGTTNTFTADGGIGSNNIARSMFFRDNGGQFGAIGFHASHATSANYAWQMASTSYSDASQIKARVKNNGTWTDPVTIWNSGNDGPGSGLDADTVDGIQASSFLRSDANDTFSHTITGNKLYLGGSEITSSSAALQVNGFQRTGTIYLHSGNAPNASANWPLSATTAGTLQWNTNTVWTSGNDGSGSGLDADTVDGIQASSFLRSDATDYLNSTMYCRNDIVVETGYRNRGVFGTYDSYKTQHIWSMGTSYRNSSSGANFGNLYGAAYKHTNNSTGGTMAGGHQLVWCQNGTGYAALGSNIWTSGNVTAYSDIRVKTNIERIPDALNKVSQLNGYTFDRTDRAEDEEPLRQTGVIAQEVLEVLPEAVTGDEDGHYSVAYGNMVGLLIESIKELKAEVDDLKTQLETK